MTYLNGLDRIIKGSGKVPECKDAETCGEQIQASIQEHDRCLPKNSLREFQLYAWCRSTTRGCRTGGRVPRLSQQLAYCLQPSRVEVQAMQTGDLLRRGGNRRDGEDQGAVPEGLDNHYARRVRVLAKTRPAESSCYNAAHYRALERHIR